ncbi:MAG: diguanylate cyclase [Pseudomonadota bacterium]
MHPPPPEIDTLWSGVAQAWAEVRQAPEDVAHWAVFMLHCDQLSTLAAEHGLQATAGALAPLLKRLEMVATPRRADALAVELLMPALETSVREVHEEGDRFSRAPGLRRENGLPLVVVLGADRSATEDALPHMEHYGYLCRQYTDAAEGVAAAAEGKAVAVVVDVENGFDEPTIAILAELVGHGIPWCAMARQSDYAMRLQAVRHGALFFFVAPLSMEALVQVLDPVAFPSEEEPYRVLVLDDSRTALSGVQKALAPFPNVRLGILSQAHKVLDVLHYFAPDVLLLDYHMGGCTGLEVAKIIRQHKAFESIPIVYLTAETNAGTQQEAMRHGGDDFLVKPVSPEQLFNAVTQKARRYRGLRRIMEEDSLTGLYNHGKTKALLQQCLHQAERQSVPLSYALLDIDHFKRINDSYGHGMGDQVIATLARHLRQRVRASDVVGRYGGEEFAVVLFDCAPDQAHALLEGMRDSFSRVLHTSGEAAFSASFSAGVAHFPACHGMAELMATADEALYAAKRGGRNRVVQAAGQAT